MFFYFLKNNNPCYEDIQINLDNIPENWVNYIDNTPKGIEITFVNDNQIQQNIYPKDFVGTLPQTHVSADETFYNVELEDDNPLDELRLNSSETAYVQDLMYEILDDACMAIAPGENKLPLPIICDENCEVLAHPYLFPTGQFGYTYGRDVALSPCKYFNQRLLNYTQAFASDSDYIFFAQAVTKHLNLNRSINIAMQKIRFEGLTAGELSKN